jgi:hypothetical protein
MKKLFIVFLFLTGLIPLFSQTKGMNDFSTAGSNIESNNMVISWTICEDLIDFTTIDATMRLKPGDNSEVVANCKTSVTYLIILFSTESYS